MAELRKQIKLLHYTLNGLTALLDMARIQISERRGHLKVADAIWIDSHQPTAGGVRSDRIVSKHEAAEAPHRTMQRPVAFHSLNPIGDNEVNRDGHREFDD